MGFFYSPFLYYIILFFSVSPAGLAGHLHPHCAVEPWPGTGCFHRFLTPHCHLQDTAVRMHCRGLTHPQLYTNKHTHTCLVGGRVNISYQSQHQKKTIKPSLLFQTTPKVLQPDFLLCFVCIPDRSTLCWGRSQALTSTGHWRTTVKYGILHLCNLTALW